MCGITGYAGLGQEGLIEAMTQSLFHRGPDDGGCFREDGVGLGIRRLSIIDVAGGHQPISNEDESLVIVFNGEIYNYRELRAGLIERGHRLTTASDTEVILHLFEEEGPAALHRLNGMFGIAIWDRRRRRLFLARDRLGVKPLYYAECGGGLLFGSESKAILRYQGFQPTLDLGAVHDYLALRYVPGPGSLFKEVRKLPPGHYLWFENGKLSVERWWAPVLHPGPWPHSEEEYYDRLVEHFERSVRMRLISEVPLGAYLSGGVDSSVIVAAMSRQLTEPVKTFTVGFDDPRDEFAEAAQVAKAVGADHTAIQCLPTDAAELPAIAYHLDEPIGDPIVLPMFLLSRAAKKRVTVVLAGEGADETWAGYFFHWVLLRALGVGRAVPAGVRSGLRPLLQAVPHQLMNLGFDYPAALGARGKAKVLDFVALLDRDRLPAAYRHLISLFDPRDTAALYTNRMADATRSMTTPSRPYRRDVPALNQILHLQFEHWLSEDILTKQDKMSMAHGIEVRVPFLDYQLVEFALQVPPALKIRGRQRKYLLRRYARQLIPTAWQRPKKPFYVPFERFLREGPFREIMEDTLADRVVRSRGLFRPEAVADLRTKVAGGEFVYVKQVFSLVMLELWYRMAIDRRGAP
jgi:asparagine synthase (glutamine-hydrolysing)